MGIDVSICVRLSSVKVEEITDEPVSAGLGTSEEVKGLSDRLLGVFDRLSATSEVQ